MGAPGWERWGPGSGKARLAYAAGRAFVLSVCRWVCCSPLLVRRGPALLSVLTCKNAR